MSARDCTVLGMPINAAEDDEIRTVQPIAAIVVVKALDEDGDVCYLTGSTDGLMTVEALGMARLAQIRLERGIAAELDATEEG